MPRKGTVKPAMPLPQQLADDLDRWLAGKPIHAHEVSVRERLVKWSRRQPLLAGAALTLGCGMCSVVDPRHFSLAKRRAACHGSAEPERCEDVISITNRNSAASSRAAVDSSRNADGRSDNKAEKPNSNSTVHGARPSTHFMPPTCYCSMRRGKGENLTAVSDLLSR